MRYPEARTFVRHRLAYEILQDPSVGVIAFAVGRRHGRGITEGKPNEFCVTAFVIRKLTPDQLSQRNLADAYLRCVQAARQIPVELPRDDFRIVESGSAVHLQAYTGSSHSKPATTNTQKWFQGLRPGIGIANPDGSYPMSLDGGTIGFFVKRDEDTSTYLVSCNHVIARERTTWTMGGVPAETIIQPASMDLTGHDISTLLRPLDLTGPFGVAALHAFVEVQIHAAGAVSPPSNSADAAIAKLTLTREPMDQLGRLPYTGRLLGTHNFEWDEAADTVKGSSHVFKCGRTTGYTEGTVTHIDGLTTLDFAGAKARFADQLVIEPTADNTGRFSEPGDSGSPVVTENHELAGMLFAGTVKQSWATPVKVVLDELTNAKDDAGNLIGPLTLAT